MSNKTAKTANTRKAATAPQRKRYSDSFKQKVVDFVESVGRGGISRAAKKYNVSPLSISTWKKKFAGGGTKPSAVTKRSLPTSRDQIVAKLAKVSSEMSATEQKLATQQKEFDSLKALL